MDKHGKIGLRKMIANLGVNGMAVVMLRKADANENSEPPYGSFKECKDCIIYNTETGKCDVPLLCSLRTIKSVAEKNHI